MLDLSSSKYVNPLFLSGTKKKSKLLVAAGLASSHHQKQMESFIKRREDYFNHVVETPPPAMPILEGSKKTLTSKYQRAREPRQSPREMQQSHSNRDLSPREKKLKHPSLTVSQSVQHLLRPELFGIQDYDPVPASYLDPKQYKTINWKNETVKKTSYQDTKCKLKATYVDDILDEQKKEKCQIKMNGPANW